MSDQGTTQPKTMRDVLAERNLNAVPDRGTAVLVRTADALQRLERLTEAMERAAAEGERQLATIRGRL